MEDEPFASALKALRGVRKEHMRQVEGCMQLLASAERRVRIEDNGDYQCGWYEPNSSFDAPAFAVALMWNHPRWEPSFELWGLHVRWEGDLAVAFIAMGRLTQLRDERRVQQGCPPPSGNERLVGDSDAEQASILADYQWVSGRAAKAQQALREIDPALAGNAARRGEASAWCLYSAMDLVTWEEFKRARDRPGNYLLWSYGSE
jgi:hypothetical protein